MTQLSFTSVFSQALRGRPCLVVGIGEFPQQLPVAAWSGEADVADRALLGHCVGATLDIGCGPGRLTACLADLGHVVLGIDIAPEAVAQTRRRKVSVLQRNVFHPLPGEGGWETALLADGNIGIGGDPEALLRRARELVGPHGRVVVELAAPGTGILTTWATLKCGQDVSRPFRWSIVAVDAVEPLAAHAGLQVRAAHDLGGRWCAVLESRP